MAYWMQGMNQSGGQADAVKGLGPMLFELLQPLAWDVNVAL